MRLWTIQPIDVWQRVSSDGFADVDPSKKLPRDHVPEQYLWLCGQLKKRIPAFNGKLLWWAHCEKPDLRTFRHVSEAHSQQVRIELEIDDGRVACFPVWAWDTVYCCDFLATTRAERAAWRRRLQAALPSHADMWPLPQPWQSELEKSWETLFNPALPPRPPWRDFFQLGRRGELVAVFEQIRRSDVVAVTEFTGTNVVMAKAYDTMRKREKSA